MKEIKKWLEANLERDITVKYAGDDKEQKETGQFLSSAFCLALIAMFMIMLIQFNNFYHTFDANTKKRLIKEGALSGCVVGL
jgi:multidrug efflux pump